MKQKSIKISQEIFDNYVGISIGYMVVSNLHHVALAKENKFNKASVFNLPPAKELTLQNLVEFEPVKNWRKIYEDCGVKPKTFKSSLESLLRRIIQNDYKAIIPIVDAYNFISVKYALSVGGYNFDKIEEELILRNGIEDDRFVPINGKEDLQVNSNHIVYADQNSESPVVCWMWNHKDSKRTMLSNETENGLFIFDCITDADKSCFAEAVIDFSNILKSYNAMPVASGLLDKANPVVYF